MFRWFFRLFKRKKKNDEVKKKKIIDKVLMGAVIGGAIGSVMGASLPEKEREEIKNAAQKVGSVFTRNKKKKKDSKKIPHEKV